MKPSDWIAPMLVAATCILLGSTIGSSCAGDGHRAEERHRFSEETCNDIHGTWNEGVINGEDAWWCSMPPRSER